MRRCNDCANSVVDSDAVCTACRLAEWKDQQEQAEAIRQRAYALEANRQAHLAKKKYIRDAIKAGIITAVSVLLFLAFVSATKEAMRYEWETKPAMLKANGVK
jgi:uncharacterized membrane protein YvbJ